MNKIMKKAKQSITNQKKKYLFLTTILIVGIISGIIFIFFISKEDKSLVKTELDTFFNHIKTNQINYLSVFRNSFFTNLLYLFIFWVLGISIIGVPIILFLLFFKGFIFGFNFSSIITNYGLKGILPGIFYQFPHQLLLLIFFVMISFYAINFSVRLFRVLFLKENINLTQCFKRYNQIGIICVIGILLCSIFETFVMPILMNLFL